MGKPHEVTLQSACNFHMVLILHIKCKTEKDAATEKTKSKQKEESEQE